MSDIDTRPPHPIDELAALQQDVRFIDSAAGMASIPRAEHVRVQEAARRLDAYFVKRAAELRIAGDAGAP